MYLFETLDPHPPTATPILGQSPKKRRVFIFTKKFGTLDLHLPIVRDKVPKNKVFLGTFPKNIFMMPTITFVGLEAGGLPCT